jgi:hypothetical protein
MDWVAIATALAGASAVLTLCRLRYKDNDKLPIIAKALMALTVATLLIGVLSFGNDLSNSFNNIGKDIGSVTIPSDTTPETTTWDPCDPTSPAWNPDATNC